jgi:lambda repressor-like predicted transcriptional regulator
MRITPEQRQKANIIRGEMTKHGVTNRRIAQLCQVHPNYIYLVLIGERTGYENIRPIIARECNTSVAELWPDTPSQYLEAA